MNPDLYLSAPTHVYIRFPHDMDLTVRILRRDSEDALAEMSTDEFYEMVQEHLARQEATS